MYLIRLPSISNAVLTIADLAGSERVSRSGAAGATLGEAGHINASLLTLGRVVEAAARGDKFIPFRDSKLTRIARPCFVGGARAAFIVCISGTSKGKEEDLLALRFGARAGKVERVIKV